MFACVVLSARALQLVLIAMLLCDTLRFAVLLPLLESRFGESASRKKAEDGKAVEKPAATAATGTGTAAATTTTAGSTTGAGLADSFLAWPSHCCCASTVGSRLAADSGRILEKGELAAAEAAKAKEKEQEKASQKMEVGPC